MNPPPPHPDQTLDRIRLQLNALFRLYVSTTRVRALRRGMGMDTHDESDQLRAQRRAMRAYLRALRTGLPCSFQRLTP